MFYECKMWPYTSRKKLIATRFWVLKAMTKNTVIWYMVPCVKVTISVSGWQYFTDDDNKCSRTLIDVS
jgi:hypothetical protein